MAFALAAMWLSSYRWYTTAGFDFERPWGDRVLARYVRVRWDAGCFWFGQAEQPHAPRGTSMDWWDPGGTLFARSIPPEPRNLANRLGWWLVGDVAQDPYEPIRYGGAISSQWVGIPGWIPPLLFAGFPLVRRRLPPIVRRTPAG